MSSGAWRRDGGIKRFHEAHWDTDHEIIFIDGLGSHSYSSMSRLELLRNYLKALSLPGPMKRMDKSRIKTYVKNSIAMEEKNPTVRRVPQPTIGQLLNIPMDDSIG